ncbi:hypothetical protein BDF20DRAFT_398271 [Mycotypha africana]|uniref:uncharacterized protein n=1 Tax=Mycotypha africana TaxID=64632 RepID=UPI002300ECB1|nr:uncharacterized protein BDF20DRAFT_398271 [Mycotypha africana]KAI8984597.1 hypothetical protein BDF20DRAFT_398271 [Mycotypha africana]
MDSMSCLQTYFESQDDREAAALVADMIALLPSKYIDSTSAIMDNDGDSHMDTHSMEKQPFYQQTECDDAREVVNNNQQQYLCMLEHALLAKESEIAMLKETALEWKHRAEANAQNYSELRYTRNLDTKNDIILSLKEQIDYLSDRLNHDHQTSHFIAAENREGEDMINANRNRQSVTVQRHRMNEEVKFDTLLDDGCFFNN